MVEIEIGVTFTVERAREKLGRAYLTPLAEPLKAAA
jgi:hypothetical protein